MGRINELKKLDLKSRNQLRSILATGGGSAVSKINKLRGRLGSRQVEALENILLSNRPTAGATPFVPFPKSPQFKDLLRTPSPQHPESLFAFLEKSTDTHRERLLRQIHSLRKIDEAFAAKGFSLDSSFFTEHISAFGWSHAILRRIALVRESSDVESDEIERLVLIAGLKSNNIVVTSLLQAFASEQNYLTVKRAALNIADRGHINRMTRALSRITFQPFAKDIDELFSMLSDIHRCSLIDAIIILKFNAHLIRMQNYPAIEECCALLGGADVMTGIIGMYLDFKPDTKDGSDGEDLFFKQSGVWLEYPIVREYRVLVDYFYDASRDMVEPLHPELEKILNEWVGTVEISNIVSGSKITSHTYDALSKLEFAGTVTRSALLNFWLHMTEGQVGFERDELFSLMGLTSDLARTVPIEATRAAAKLAGDEEVKLVLLLLLAKRSKNEKDHYQLRRLIERLAKQYHNGSLVQLVSSYEFEHPHISDYIYEIATEDFLAKCNGLAPHLSDIPEIRANLHEWKARATGNEFYLERARAVRIDHQLNRVRNEIDDHRIYVDPSRFSSWINDELMLELNGALTVVGIGKKTAIVNSDDVLLSSLVQRSYTAFCSNAVFGIASYIGRRIRHGTFYGHLYSGVVNHVEGLSQFQILRRDSGFASRWSRWKEQFETEVKQIINERLHVVSKQKPLGLLQPEAYSPHKLEILAASVRALSSNYAESKTTEGLDQVIVDYCWRLAGADLIGVVAYLKSRQPILKNTAGLDELYAVVDLTKKKAANEFKRETMHFIDTRLQAMYGWFKRPSNISPKASLALLYDAVVAEVKDTFPSFDPKTASSDLDDIELIGGAYHVLYDSFYVVVFNAAKHGDPLKPVKRRFSLVVENGKKHLVIEIANALRPGDNPVEIARIVKQRKEADHSDANLYERRSGIPKLMQFAHTRKEFKVEFLDVVCTDLMVRFSYALDH